MTDTTPTAGPATTPPWFVRAVMGRMTRVLNPLLGRMAGRKHLKMAAQIHHQGRRSGKPYMTPASARLDGTTFWIPLTFGPGSDWCRNVRAAGGCSITWNGVEYRVCPAGGNRPGRRPARRPSSVQTSGAGHVAPPWHPPIPSPRPRGRLVRACSPGTPVRNEGPMTTLDTAPVVGGATSRYGSGLDLGEPGIDGAHQDLFILDVGELLGDLAALDAEAVVADRGESGGQAATPCPSQCATLSSDSLTTTEPGSPASSTKVEGTGQCRSTEPTGRSHR